MKNKYRHERKYALAQSDLGTFIASLYLNNFTEIYTPRRINNIYYDNLSSKSLNDNIEGYSNRLKARIRWYDDNFMDSNLELKLKKSDANRKEVILLKNFSLDRIEFDENLFNENLDLYFTHNLNEYFPVLQNKYYRYYFISACSKIRITIDSEIFSKSLITLSENIDNNLIVEMKYNVNDRFLNYHLKQLNLTKNSKYVKGALSTNNYNNTY